MSTTHPTNITTEWDDLQRKHGNLPKLEEQETNEVRDSRLVEIAERELLREARLKEWKRRVQARVQPIFGVPVHINEENFVREVTNASKAVDTSQTGDADDAECNGKDDVVRDSSANAGESQSDLLSTAGQYIPVLLLDDRREAAYLRQAWNELARRHPHVKFTVAPANRVLKCDNSNAVAPSSLLLYFGGRCIMQRPALSILQSMTYELADSSVECRIANALEAVLNSVSGHGAFLCTRPEQASSDSEIDSDESDNHALRSAGKSFQRDFLSRISGGKMRRDSDSESDRETTAKTYTSWVFDRALK